MGGGTAEGVARGGAEPPRGGCGRGHPSDPAQLGGVGETPERCNGSEKPTLLR